jgi:hypothetical protein
MMSLSQASARLGFDRVLDFIAVLLAMQRRPAATLRAAE